MFIIIIIIIITPPSPSSTEGDRLMWTLMHTRLIPDSYPIHTRFIPDAYPDAAITSALRAYWRTPILCYNLLYYTILYYYNVLYYIVLTSASDESVRSACNH